MNKDTNLIWEAYVKEAQAPAQPQQQQQAPAQPQQKQQGMLGKAWQGVKDFASGVAAGDTFGMGSGDQGITVDQARQQGQAAQQGAQNPADPNAAQTNQANPNQAAGEQQAAANPQQLAQQIAQQTKGGSFGKLQQLLSSLKPEILQQVQQAWQATMGAQGGAQVQNASVDVFLNKIDPDTRIMIERVLRS